MHYGTTPPLVDGVPCSRLKTIIVIYVVRLHGLAPTLVYHVNRGVKVLVAARLMCLGLC